MQLMEYYFDLMGAYLLFLINSNQVEQIDEELLKEKFAWGKSALLLILGFALTIGGADFAIDSAGNIAREFGISEWMIGLFSCSLWYINYQNLQFQ